MGDVVRLAANVALANCQDDIADRLEIIASRIRSGETKVERCAVVMLEDDGITLQQCGPPITHFEMVGMLTWAAHSMMHGS